jgi:hypothetical protein
VGPVVVVPWDGQREQMVSRLITQLRRAGVPVHGPTGWEAHDASVPGSLALQARIVTVGAPSGVVQVRIHRRPRVRAIVACLATVVLTITVWPIGVGLAALVTLDTARGAWRTGPGLRRTIGRVAGEL